MKICNINKCDKEAKKTGLCETHYRQIKSYGGIKHLRTLPNEYIIKSDIVYITLYDRYHNPINRKAVIDLEDFHLVKDKRLARSHTKTSERIIVFDKLNNTKKKLHRIIMGEPEGMIVDHKNRNGYDNRKSNLRICTQAENNMNKSSKGFYFHKQNKNYAVEIMKDGIKTTKAGFKTEKEAIKYRTELEQKTFGEFAPIRNNNEIT